MTIKKEDSLHQDITAWISIHQGNCYQHCIAHLTAYLCCFLWTKNQMFRDGDYVDSVQHGQVCPSFKRGYFVTNQLPVFTFYYLKIQHAILLKTEEHQNYLQWFLERCSSIIDSLKQLPRNTVCLKQIQDSSIISLLLFPKQKIKDCAKVTGW